MNSDAYTDEKIRNMIHALNKAFVWIDTPQGQKYWESVETNLKSLIKGDFEYDEQPEYYHIGQRFLIDGDIYMLSRIADDEVALISIDDGNSWSGSIEVEDSRRVTESEMDELTDYTRYTSVKENDKEC